METAMRLSGNKLNLTEKPIKYPPNYYTTQKPPSPSEKTKIKEFDDEPQPENRIKRKSQAPRSIPAQRVIKHSKSMVKPERQKQSRHTTFMDDRIKLLKRQSLPINQNPLGKTIRTPDPKSKVTQLVSEDWVIIEAYFRYSPMSVITLCGQRAELNQQLQQGMVRVFNNNPKKQETQFHQKLLKHCRLKGKYKYRQRHNPFNSQQLKNCGYKFIRKESKKTKKQSESSDESEQEKGKQKFRDLVTWKKNMGTDSKVFIVKGGYHQLRHSLLERGWIQNPDKFSKLFDFKWTTKINDIEFTSLEPQQIVNHFNSNHSLTSKFGLCKTIRCLVGNDAVDVDRFYPRCFDLADLSDFQNFIENYKFTYCQSILKRYVKDKSPNQSKVLIAMQALDRKLVPLKITTSHLSNRVFALCSPQEWAILTNQQMDPQFIKKTISKSERFQPLVQKSKEMLDKLKLRNPQFSMDGTKNIWILKPNYLSRGRGIKCFSKMNDILDLIFNKDIQYVAQKYIQNPLVIKGKKFDIRQWVLVEDYSMSKIWMFDECYLRLCAEDYDMNNLSNKYVHLTNNSIQKYSKQFYKSQIQGNMMYQSQFSEYLGMKDGKPLFDEIRKKMKDIIINTIRVTEDQVIGRKNSFQLFGYDFMIDTDLNPWLIEVNSSPSMDTSTPVTKRLVKLVLQDCIKVTVDQRKKKKADTGMFKCIYKGGEYSKSPYLLNGG